MPDTIYEQLQAETQQPETQQEDIPVSNPLVDAIERDLTEAGVDYRGTIHDILAANLEFHLVAAHVSSEARALADTAKVIADTAARLAGRQ